jgi:hypothetical protein
MAAERIIFPQFRDEQSDSRYPFSDAATLVTTDGGLTLAKNIFIDATFYPIGGGSAAHLESVTVEVNKVTVRVATTTPAVTITAEYDPLQINPQTTNPADTILSFFDDFGRPAGVIVFNPERVAEIYQWGFGTYLFGPTSAPFAATVCIPAQEPGVRGLLINGTDFVTGDVTLLGSAGVVLSVAEENVIRVDVTGVPLFNRLVCADAGTDKPPQKFITTINNCPPDEFGNFIITTTNRTAEPDTTVLRVYPTDYGLVIAAVGGSEV